MSSALASLQMELPFHPNNMSNNNSAYSSLPGISPHQLQSTSHPNHTLPPLHTSPHPPMQPMYGGGAPQTPRTLATPNNVSANSLNSSQVNQQSRFQLIHNNPQSSRNYQQQQQQQQHHQHQHQQHQHQHHQHQQHQQHLMTGNNEQNYRPMTTMLPHSPTATPLSYTQAIAPAPQNRSSQPPRPISHGLHAQTTLQSPFGQNNIMSQMADMEPPTHVVGSQGRRGILPSAPGRPPVTSSTGRSTMIPAKDSEGKFPCPHCTKSYLHAKHLKRHLLRHTGDRPYMCILCRDTFSRSDILKRHFQKCSIRRGNPTGASHLSHSQAHLKKTQSSPHKHAADSPMVDVNTMGSQGAIGNNNASIPIFAVNSDSTGAENGANLANHQPDAMLTNGLKRQSTVENDARNMTPLSGSGVQTRASLESAYTASTPSTMPPGMNPSLAFSMPHAPNGHSYNQSYEYTPNVSSATSTSSATHASASHRNEMSRDGESMQSYPRNSCLFRESQGHV